MTRDTFAAGMTAIYTTWLELKKPTKQTFDLWFSWLEKIPDKVFIEACQELCVRTGYRPQNIVGEINEIAERLSGKLSADEAYAIIEDTVEGYLGAGMSGETCKTAIKHSLESRGYSELVGLALSWGVEIWQNSNPTATRAQFRNSFEKETHLIDEKRKQIRRGETKTIEGSLHQIFEDVDEKHQIEAAEKAERKRDGWNRVK